MANHHTTTSPRRSPLLTPNFILLVTGQGLSLFGNMTMRFAMSMWVLDETGSATIFASLLAISIVPTIICSPFGGILADRINRRTMTVGLDALSGLVTLATTLYFTAASTFNMVAVGTLMVSLAMLDSLETPTVQAALPQIVGTANEILLRQGMAVVNQVQQLASLLPSFLGGILYAAVGIRPTLIITIACFCVAAFAECFLKLDNPRRIKEHRINSQKTSKEQDQNPKCCDSSIPELSPNSPFSTLLDDAKATWRFLTHDRPDVLKLMATATLLNFFTVGYSGVGFPYMVRNILGFNAAVYGTCDGLVGMAGLLGAIVAGMFAAHLSIQRFPATCLVLAATIIPCGIAFTLPISNHTRLAIIVGSMCCSTIATAFTNLASIPAIQLATPSELTGKVLALLSSFATAAQPLGQLAYGLAYDRLAPQWPAWLSIAGITIVVALSAQVFTHFDTK